MPDPVVDPPAPEPSEYPLGSPRNPHLAPAAEPEKLFTQDEVNAFLAKARRTTPPDDYEDLKAAAARLAEIEAANQTELERAQTERDALKAERDAALETAKTTTLRSSILAAASKAGAVDPDDVFALIDKNAVTIGDDGQVTGAEDAVKALLEAKPHLVGKARPTGNPDGGPQGNPGLPQLSRDDLKSMTPEAIVEAKANGQLSTLLGITT